MVILQEMNMYGTIFQLKAKPGQEEKLVEVFKEWEDTRKPNTQGAVATCLMKKDEGSDEFIGVAIFSNKDTYRANAEDPAQDIWYRKMRELLESDPVWNDGEFLYLGM